MATPAQLLEAALDYAARGWPVLPLHSIRADGGCTCLGTDCSSPGKHPRTRTGLTEASTDPEMIQAWFRRWPGSNIGLRTGLAFDVLDVDDPTGDAWWTLAANKGYEHPPGLTVVTGSGGLHVYFAPGTSGNKVRFSEHLDWRGEGGYVVAPPSIHATGQEYAWV